MPFAQIADSLADGGTISPEDLAALRREGWADGRITPEEAEAIMRLNARLTADAAWSDFFIEAIGEYVVNALEPRGYVSVEQGAWLMARLGNDGVLETMTELELLVRVFEKAQGVPEALRGFALEQVARAVLEGEGPTRDGGELEAGRINRTETALIRRIIFASGSESPASVSQREAELLFRLKDAAAGADNSPEWKKLFVQGVGNYLQGLARSAPDRDRAAELEAFMNDTRSSVGGFLGRVAHHAIHANRLGKVFGRKVAPPSLATRVTEAEAITGEERVWLDAKIHADGEIDAYEQALLDFLETA